MNWMPCLSFHRNWGCFTPRNLILSHLRYVFKHIFKLIFHLCHSNTHARKAAKSNDSDQWFWSQPAWAGCPLPASLALLPSSEMRSRLPAHSDMRTKWACTESPAHSDVRTKWACTESPAHSDMRTKWACTESPAHSDVRTKWACTESMWSRPGAQSALQECYH